MRLGSDCRAPLLHAAALGGESTVPLWQDNSAPGLAGRVFSLASLQGVLPQNSTPDMAGLGSGLNEDSVGTSSSHSLKFHFKYPFSSKVTNKAALT